MVHHRRKSPIQPRRPSAQSRHRPRGRRRGWRQDRPPTATTCCPYVPLFPPCIPHPSDSGTRPGLREGSSVTISASSSATDSAAPMAVVASAWITAKTCGSSRTAAARPVFHQPFADPLSVTHSCGVKSPSTPVMRMPSGPTAWSVLSTTPPSGCRGRTRLAAHPRAAADPNAHRRVRPGRSGRTIRETRLGRSPPHVRWR